MTPPPPPAEPLASGAEHEVLVLEAPRGWPGLGLLEVWRHRGLLAVLVGRDVRVRYKQTVLGVLWALLRPLATMATFALILGRVADLPSEGRPYALFALTGLLPWTFASSAVGSGGLSLVNAAAWIRKIWFPRLLLPLACLGAAALDLLLSLLLLIPTLLLAGLSPATPWLLIPLLLLWLALATAGVSVLLAALTARWRDFAHALPFLLQLGLFVTPVLYPRSALPPSGRTLAALNPLAGPVESLRAVLLGTPLDGPGLALSLGVGLLLTGAALLSFRLVERRLAEVL